MSAVEPIRIEALDDLDEMQERFHGSIGKLAPAMDLSVGDERGELGEVRISGIGFSGVSVHISYKYSWTAYWGCEDRNVYAEEDGVVSGIRIGDTWVFQPFVPPEPRSTRDEF